MNIQKHKCRWLLATFLVLTLSAVTFAQTLNQNDDDDADDDDNNAFHLVPYGPPRTDAPANATMIDGQEDAHFPVNCRKTSQI